MLTAPLGSTQGGWLVDMHKKGFMWV